MTCGHACCAIPHNAYHAHAEPPDSCRRCVRNDGPPGVQSGGTQRDESAVLGRLVADVITRVAPEIPGLPGGAQLRELVAHHALAVFAAAVTDPDMHALDERSRRTVLAARVGVELAFPR